MYLKKRKAEEGGSSSFLACKYWTLYTYYKYIYIYILYYIHTMYTTPTVRCLFFFFFTVYFSSRPRQVECFSLFVFFLLPILCAPLIVNVFWSHLCFAFVAIVCNQGYRVCHISLPVTPTLVSQMSLVGWRRRRRSVLDTEVGTGLGTWYATVGCHRLYIFA